MGQGVFKVGQNHWAHYNQLSYHDTIGFLLCSQKSASTKISVMNVLIGLLVYNRLAVYHKEKKNILKQHSPPILGICKIVMVIKVIPKKFKITG